MANKFKDKTLNILGTDYKFEFKSESEEPKLQDKDGFCDTTVK